MLTSKQIKHIVREFELTPGYIHTSSGPLSRAQFEQIFEDTLDIDILEPEFAVLGNSVAKRFKYFLQTATDDQVDQILQTLRD